MGPAELWKRTLLTVPFPATQMLMMAAKVCPVRWIASGSWMRYGAESGLIASRLCPTRDAT
jgi:hypothetical protein